MNTNIENFNKDEIMKLFEESIEIAKQLGISEDRILYTKERLDAFFNE